MKWFFMDSNGLLYERDFGYSELTLERLGWRKTIQEAKDMALRAKLKSINSLLGQLESAKRSYDKLNKADVTKMKKIRYEF